jgi:hypothetical protein
MSAHFDATDGDVNARSRNARLRVTDLGLPRFTARCQQWSGRCRSWFAASGSGNRHREGRGRRLRLQHLALVMHFALYRALTRARRRG